MSQDQPKLRRCPKCRSAAIVLTEVGYVGISFEQTVSGRWRRVHGDWGEDSFKVEASCRACQHIWTLRGQPCLPGGDIPWHDDEGVDEDPTVTP